MHVLQPESQSCPPTLTDRTYPKELIAKASTLSVTERDPGVAFATYSLSGNIGQVNGYSTIIVDNTFYIDLEIGEAYFISNNVYSSANYAVQIPPKLPTLRSGASIITYSNTITNFKITPRWWKI